MKRLFFLGLVCVCTLGMSCIPVSVSPECQSKIDACLKLCQQGAPPPVNEDNLSPPPLDNQTSTQCEQDCFDMCE